jgi:hypothetical protein
MGRTRFMEITQHAPDEERARALLVAHRADPECVTASLLPPVPGDPRLDGRPWRVVSVWPHDGRAVGVDGVILLP